MSDEYDDKQHDTIGVDSPNSTYLQPGDADPDKEAKYERMWRYNEGLWKSRNRVDNEEAWRRGRIVTLHAIASDLELNDYQRQEATGALQEIDLGGASNGQQTSLEAYCFAICAFVANADAKPHREGSSIYLPAKSSDKNPDRFVRVQRSLKLSETEIEKAMDELRVEFEGL